MEKFIQNIKENGYRTDLNVLLLKAFTLYKGIFLPSFVVLMLTSLAVFGMYTAIIFSYFPNAEVAAQELMKFDINSLNQTEMYQYFAFNALLNVLIAITNVGIYTFAKHFHKHQKINTLDSLKTIFGIKGIQIVIYVFILQFGISVLSWYMQQIGFASVSLLITLIIHTLTLLVVPIVISENTTIFKAIKYSTDIVNIKPFKMLWYLIFGGIISISGLMFFGIGILFSFPMFYIFLFVLYDQIKNQDIIN